MEDSKTNVDIQLEPQSLNVAERVAYLDSLPCEGDFDFREREMLVDVLAATGMSLYELRKLSIQQPAEHFPDLPGQCSAAWVHWEDRSLAVTPVIYTAMWPITRERGIGMIAAHELWHIQLPPDEFASESTGVLNGEQSRLHIYEWLDEVLDQTLATNIMLTNYQRALAERFVKCVPGSRSTLSRESGAILCQIGLAAREYLEQVQILQWAALREKYASRPELLRFTHLITEPDSSEAKGIDVFLIQLIEGVETVEDLREHSKRFRQLLQSS